MNLAKAVFIFLLFNCANYGVASLSLEEECLQVHNKYRARHQAPPVKWSPFLVEKAVNWSRHLAKTDKLTHERGSSENLYKSFGKAPKNPCTVATDAFYSEVKMYDYNNPLKKWASTGHFTQVVWKATTEIGATALVYNVTNAYNKTINKFLLVVKYRPNGNMMSEKSFKKNVLPPLSDGENDAQRPGIAFVLVLGALVAALANVYLV